MWNPALSLLAWFQRNLKFFGTTLTIGWLLLSVNETTILGTLLIIANITSVSIVTFITFLATLKMVITLVRASVLPFEECVAALHWSNVSNRSSAALGETLLGRWRRGNVWSKCKMRMRRTLWWPPRQKMVYRGFKSLVPSKEHLSCRFPTCSPKVFFRGQLNSRINYHTNSSLFWWNIWLKISLNKQKTYNITPMDR